MENIKIILSIVFIFSAFSANSQINETKTISKNEDVSELSLTVKIDSSALITKLLKIKGVSSAEVDSNRQIVVINYDSRNNAVIEEIDKIKKKINALLVDYIRPIEEPVAVEQVKFNPEIDKFLNLKDSSIFSDEKFMNLPDEQIHPRSKDYYLLIQNIYNLKNLLKEVSVLPFGQKPKAKEKLSKALDIINTINDNTDKCYKLPLSKEQKDFYINQVNEFNRLYEDI